MHGSLAAWGVVLVGALMLGCSSPSAPPASSKAAATAPAAVTAPAKAPAAATATIQPAPTIAMVPSPPASPDAVRLAHVPSTLFAPLYVAIEKGYLQEQAINTQLEVITAGQDAMTLTAQGQLDAVVGGFGAATFNAIDRGLEIRVVGSMGAQPQSGFPSALT